MRFGILAMGLLAWVGCGGGGGDASGLPRLAADAVGKVTATAANPVALATYADGSFVVAGGFNGDAVFGSGEPNETTITNAGAFFSDAFVARYEADGSLRWARGFGDVESDDATAVAALPDGSALVAGSFEGEITLGAGEPNETLLIGVGLGDVDMFLARYAADGSLVWASVAGGPGYQWVNELNSLADGSCYLAGAYAGEAVFGPGEAGETTIQSVGARDAYVARYLPDGAIEWVRGVGGSDFDGADGLAVLPDGGCAIAGNVSGTVVFGAGEPNETTLVVSDAAPDGFLARYAADGTLRWARSGVATAGGGYFEDVAVLSGGDLVVTGLYEGLVTFDAGGPNETSLYALDASDASLASTSLFPADGFVCGYGQDGSLRWAHRFGDPVEQDTYGKKLAALPGGGFVLGSSFPRQLIVDGQGAVASSSTPRVFLLVYDAAGEPLALDTCGGDGEGSVGGVAALPDGAFMVAGWSATTTFRCGSRSASGWVRAGMFVARYPGP